jgi:hypothetical protein
VRAPLGRSTGPRRRARDAGTDNAKADYQSAKPARVKEAQAMVQPRASKSETRSPGRQRMSAIRAKLKFQPTQDVRDRVFIEPAGLQTLGSLGEERSPIAPVSAKGFARELPELAPAHSGATVLFL